MIQYIIIGFIAAALAAIAVSMWLGEVIVTFLAKKLRILIDFQMKILNFAIVIPFNHES